MFPDLNLPAADLRIRTQNNVVEVFDAIRKLYLVLTPEEWVRQHIVHYLIGKGYPKGLLEIEKQISLFNTEKRVDILVRTAELKPLLLIECKAAEIRLSEKEAEQLARYQIALKAPLCMLSNGLQHIVMQFANGKIIYLQELPHYTNLSTMPFK